MAPPRPGTNLCPRIGPTLATTQPCSSSSSLTILTVGGIIELNDPVGLG